MQVDNMQIENTMTPRTPDVTEESLPPHSPRVSVIIPTIHRPGLLRRAVKSVLDQTIQLLEVIVVIDGDDRETLDSLANEHDPRIKVVVNAKSLGAGRSRNIGVAHSIGYWIAFLDDDDEWMPTKLEKQIALVAGRQDVLVTSLSRVVSPRGVEFWPTMIYDNASRFDDYLFDKRTPFTGSSFIQTSSQFLSRALFAKSPFPDASVHDDWEFVLKLTCQHCARVETVREVLVVHYVGYQELTLSNRGSWKASLQWLERLQPIMSRRAYSGFCLGVIGPRAANAGDFAAFFQVLKHAFQNGSPTPTHLLFFFVIWLLPQNVRTQLRTAVRRRHINFAVRLIHTSCSRQPQD